MCRLLITDFPQFDHLTKTQDLHVSVDREAFADSSRTRATVCAKLRSPTS